MVLSEALTEAFPTVTPVERPKVESPSEKIDSYWLVGFTEGEGCFFVKITKSKTHKTGSQVLLKFQITQHTRDTELMKSLVNYLSCGSYHLVPGRDHGNFEVTKFSDITDKIIPLFDKYPLEGAKAKDFADFKRAVEIMKDKGHLTKEGLDQLWLIKAGMNRGR